MLRVLCLSLAVVVTVARATAAEAPPVMVGPQAGAAITIYGNDLALVREHRSFRLPTAAAQLAFTGVSRLLQPETALFQIVPSNGVRPGDVHIIDQTFAFDVITPQALLQRSVGQDVTVVTTNPATGRETSARARILSSQGGVVLDIGGKIYSGAPGRIEFDALPQGLQPAPTLMLDVAGPTGADIGADISYLTGGLDWHADYVAQYDGEGVDLTGWATIRNTSGADFKDAKITLAAGAVNRVVPPLAPGPLGAAQAQAAIAPVVPVPAQPAEVEGLHLYPIDRPVSLATGESKQLMLMRTVSLPVKREYVVRGQPSFYVTPMAAQPVQGGAEIEAIFKNETPRPEPRNGRTKSATGEDSDETAAGLGVPLPAGTVRAYGEDETGAPQFLGEDHIDQVPEGGEVRLHLGQDLDIPVVREQTAFARASDSITVTGWRITVRNTKAKTVAVRVDEPLSANWEIVRESEGHTTSADGTPEWLLTIPPKGQAVLEYNVKAQL